MLCSEERDFANQLTVSALSASQSQEGPQFQYNPPNNLASGNAFASTKLHGIPALSVVEPSDTACWGSTEEPWTAALAKTPGCLQQSRFTGETKRPSLIRYATCFQPNKHGNVNGKCDKYRQQRITLLQELLIL